MTTLVARQPLHPLSMSSTQRAPRRLSARLREREDAQPPNNGYVVTGSRVANGVTTARTTLENVSVNKKRKIGYNEEDDGFLFTRAKTRKPRISTSKPASLAEPLLNESDRSRIGDTQRQDENDGPTERQPKKRRNKMSFSTPDASLEKPLRRSKRLSDEHHVHDKSPHQNSRIKEGEQPAKSVPATRFEEKHAHRERTPTKPAEPQIEGDHSATKIALPFADTPVIRRNKAMREGRGGKGERRSSLSLRGRRASSLIDSGTSNALPHNEVNVNDFYKHIESQGLPEPRRMRQLLTWCATRSLGQKPVGSEFEDQSARMAARVIQEELLKDFANRSEMSDWFTREDMPKAVVPLTKRPHPKNVQNAAKIEELEGQIRQLQVERQSLESLLKPPSIPALPANNSVICGEISPADKSLLSGSDNVLLDSLSAASVSSQTVSERLNSMVASIRPTVDAFADGLHQIGQYRDAADSLARKVLGICAQKLDDREKEGRRRALGEISGAPTSKEDFGHVLRSLSKLER